MGTNNQWWKKNSDIKVLDVECQKYNCTLYFNAAWMHSIVNALTSKNYVKVVGVPVMLALNTSSLSWHEQESCLGL